MLYTFLNLLHCIFIIHEICCSYEKINIQTVYRLIIVNIIYRILSCVFFNPIRNNFVYTFMPTDGSYLSLSLSVLVYSSYCFLIYLFNNRNKYFLIICLFL